MESKLENSPIQFDITALLTITAIAALLATGVHYLRKPIRDGKQIRPGNSSAQVHELLGTPTQVFYSNAELRASQLISESFVFSSTDKNQSGVPALHLPFVAAYTEWFEYTPSAGHLVYYDEKGVRIVFWGGT